MTMHDFFDMDTAIARVFLRGEGDKRSIAMLSDSALLIIYKGKRHLFQSEDIKGLGTEDKKQLLPLILGGIAAPFAFLSFFVQPVQPWIHLIAILLGLLLLYIGWLGKPALVVRLKKGEESAFYLSSVSVNLEGFIAFANGIINQDRDNPFSALLFLVIEESNVELLFNESERGLPVFPIYGYTYHQLPEQIARPMILVAIDPMLTGREITFEYNALKKMLMPRIDGPIKPLARVEIPAWIK